MRDFRVLYKLLQPFLISLQITTQEEVEDLYQQAMEEIQQDAFRGIGFLVSATGYQPS